MKLRLGSLLICSVLTLSGAYACGGNKEVTTADDVAPGVDNARRALRNSWPRLLAERESQKTHANPLQRYFTMERPSFGLIHADALRTFYTQNGWTPVFTENGLPNFRARAVLEVAADADRHGLQSGKYLRPRIQELITRQGELRHALASLPQLSLGDSEWAAVDALLESPEMVALERPLPQLLDRMLSESPSNSPTPDLARAWQDRIQLIRAIAGGDIELELAIADAWLDWAWDMSDAYVGKYDFRADKEAELAQKLRQEQLVASMAAVAVATDAQSVRDFANSKAPKHPQYERLLASRARYQEIVRNGGWEEIAPVSLARGSSGKAVAALKTRLQIEGYYEGEIDERFDNALEAAVKRYQSTHQMEDTGRSNADFWNSLNTSAEDRLAQIELSVQRWRESNISHKGTYIFINIPDFYSELWKDGELERRWKIVVGNTRRECRNGRRIYSNATPVQSANMSFVVLNPTWTVPPRITNEEILPALLENPNYLEENNYERIVADNGFTMIRQMPGPNNALGAVKFMFPNEHDTYMHDTPRKQFFTPIYRAYSHGCMRAEDPMGLLENILTLDGQWDANNIRRIRETNREYRMNLRTPIPVHSEYFVVRVDDEGHTHFLSDLYRLDRERLDPRFVREEPCTVTPRPGSNLRLSADGDLMIRDTTTGELVAAHQAEEPAPTGNVIGDSGSDDAPVLVPAGLPADMGP